MVEERKLYKLEYRYVVWPEDGWEKTYGKYEVQSPYDGGLGYYDIKEAAYDLDSARLVYLGEAVEFRICEVTYSISSRVMRPEEYEHLGRATRQPATGTVLKTVEP